MGSTYSRYISDRDPIDDCYDWPITGIPGEDLYFESQTEAKRKLNIPQANIWKVIVGERKTAGGFTFRELSREEESQYI